MEYIAVITTDFPEKFGIPRQSGIVKGAMGLIKFEKKYRHPDAVRGLEDFDYLWLIWHIDGTENRDWSATVRPPKMGGNTHIGVFATRSPFRPNPLGLSCVKLEKIDFTPDGPEIFVSGVDLRDGTKIYDIKPYLPYADSHPDAKAGFAEKAGRRVLKVECKEELLAPCSPLERKTILELLAEDPRPAYQKDADRIYGMRYASYEIHFKVQGEILTVVDLF
ncbi:MAG: tRNA (N6-threonylcarbamoyladenosine(37)-N6)-methyltransferase TrmO [Lachnospiraceae bacterium]|nr:tRNA (N6-threonylcarbamoyladenosine(37)-N6)-methyltransferase TrmO [Lachnospiraceae bacterium]